MYFPILKGTLSSSARDKIVYVAICFPILKGTLSSAQLELAWRAVAVFPILKGTLSSMLGVSSQHLYRVTFQSSKELYLLFGNVRKHRNLNPFQSSKELYLLEDQREVFERFDDFPILKGTLSSGIPFVYPDFDEDFPILKGTLSSRLMRYVPFPVYSFQSSKELYLQSAGALSADADPTFQSSKELYLLHCDNNMDRGLSLSNPQRNFIFYRGRSRCRSTAGLSNPQRNFIFALISPKNQL